MEQQDLIRIKCPRCGAVLAVKRQPGIDGKNVTCPVCKYKNLFSEFKPLPQEGAKKQHPYGNPGESTAYRSREETDYLNKKQGAASNDPGTTVFANGYNSIGQLHIIPNGRTYKLHEGTNIIGRQSPSGNADVPINTGEKRRMSRQHLVIEVAKDSRQGYVHKVSLYKKECNATYINDDQLNYGDCIILKHGYIIKLPDIALKFEICDEDMTEFTQ